MMRTVIIRLTNYEKAVFIFSLVSTRDGQDGAELTWKTVNFAPPHSFPDPDGPDPWGFKPIIRGGGGALLAAS